MFRVCCCFVLVENLGPIYHRVARQPGPQGTSHQAPCLGFQLHQGPQRAPVGVFQEQKPEDVALLPDENCIQISELPAWLGGSRDQSVCSLTLPSDWIIQLFGEISKVGRGGRRALLPVERLEEVGFSLQGLG